MKNNLLEYIILYLLVACTALVFATLARVFMISIGFDDFTAFIVFIVVLAIQAVIYLCIHVVLQNLMLPWIGRLLMKIPYFRDKTSINKVAEDNTEQQTSLSLEDIRKEQLENKAEEQKDTLNVALEYTRKSFALYLSDKHLEILCQNIQIYVGKLDVKKLHSVNVKELSAVDLRHFGWNIWNFFKPRNQMDIAYFLKIVFPDVFKEATEESIKSHLKDDELKGIIKIQESLL